MNERQPILVVVTFLFVLVLITALALVYSKHQSRQLFNEVAQLKSEVDKLNTEWGQLQLEQSSWSEHGRIERIARSRLSMVLPDNDEVVFVQP